MRNRASAKVWFVPLALLLLSSVGCDFETSVDWDREADFSSLKTYAWAGRRHEEVSDLVHRRILDAVNTQLQAKGLSENESNPDVYVTYHGDDNERVVVDTTHYGYGYGRGWRWRGYGGSMSTSRVRTYKEGTLIVDIYRAAAKELIWRGTVTGTISEDPQKNTQLINKGVQKVFEKFPPPPE